MKRLMLFTSVLLLVAGCAVTPRPFTGQEIVDQAEQRLAKVTAEQERVTRPITLYEAMARAIKYNLDFKVEMMEEALKVQELKLARFDQLPQLVATAEYNGRNYYSGASSSRLIDKTTIGDQSLVASTSAERDIFTSDLTLSWDVLDFGLSYVRAKQKADEALIANERKRRVVNRIIEDVRTAYWRAVSAERLIKRLGALEGDINSALASSKRVQSRGKAAPLTALTYQRELLTIKQEIHKLQRELIVAKKQLAALMNIDPNQPFELVLPDRMESTVNFSADPRKMIDVALQNRPELREISYRQRINEKEAKTALLKLLPNLRAYGGFNYDSNDFLFTDNWAGWGARASWNVVQAFRYPAQRKTVDAQQAVLDQQALALTMAVMTQVHVSLARFELEKRRVETMRDYHGVQSKIMNQINAGYRAERVSRQTYIREQMNKIVAEAKFDIALADLQNAFANMHASMGIDPYGPDVRGDENVVTLANKLRSHWQARGGDVRFASEQIKKPVPVAMNQPAEKKGPVKKLLRSSEAPVVQDLGFLGLRYSYQ